MSLRAIAGLDRWLSRQNPAYRPVSCKNAPLKFERCVLLLLWHLSFKLVTHQDTQIIPAAIKNTIYIHIVSMHTVKCQIASGNKEAVIRICIRNGGQRRTEPRKVFQLIHRIQDASHHALRSLGIAQIRNHVIPNFIQIPLGLGRIVNFILHRLCT